MSWVVEQSANTSAVNVNGDTITSTNKGSYGSPINVMYNDPANENGQYFWEIEVQESDNGNVSVGLTTEQSFRAGWGLKAMKYLGNLSDGSSLLVQQFGDQIKNKDKVGLLLQLTNEDLKMYIFHNDQPLGLAFHVQSPYPKPLYPVVSFNSNGQIKISRSQQIPTSLNRGSSQSTGVEGTWKIVDYPEHTECVGVQLEIKQQNQHTYRLHSRIVNNLNCTLEHYPTTNQWTPSPVLSTMMAGPPSAMNKESKVSKLISGIQNLDVQNDQQLVIQSNGQQIRLERFAVPAPGPVTNNIFS